MDNLWIIYGYGWWYIPTPLNKYVFVNWDDSSQYMDKYNSCSEPPYPCISGKSRTPR